MMRLLGIPICRCRQVAARALAPKQPSGLLRSQAQSTDVVQEQPPEVWARSGSLDGRFRK